MEIDTTRIRQLLDKRDEIDAELAAAVLGTTTPRERKQQVCGTCSQPGHTTRTCPNKQTV